MITKKGFEDVCVGLLLIIGPRQVGEGSIEDNIDQRLYVIAQIMNMWVVRECPDRHEGPCALGYT